LYNLAHPSVVKVRFAFSLVPCLSRQSMFALGTVPGAAIQWDQQEQKCAILTMINAMLPATIVLSLQHSTPSEWPLYRAYGACRKVRPLRIQLMRRQTYCS